jgi:hypothetical protein
MTILGETLSYIYTTQIYITGSIIIS